MWQSAGALLEERDLRLTSQWLLSESTRSKRQMQIDPYQTQTKRRLRVPKENYLSMKKWITTKDKTKWKRKEKKLTKKLSQLTWSVGQPDQIFIYYIKLEVQLEFNQIQISF